MASLDIRPLRERELGLAVAVTSEAFGNSPAYTQMQADPARRAGFLRWLFERNYWLRLDAGSGRCVFDRVSDGNADGSEPELVMFFMLERPGLPRLTTWDMLRAGLLAGFVTQGVGPMMKLLETKAWFEAQEREALGARAGTVARLERVTVLPSRQGRGVGSAALRAALRKTDALGLAVFLATQEERNVRFYKRLGFAVIADTVCPIGAGYRNWMMLREPEATAPSE